MGIPKGTLQPSEMLPEDELGDISPEELAALIRDVVLQMRKSRAHRDPDSTKALRGALRELCQWEREATDNYGVSK